MKDTIDFPVEKIVYVLTDFTDENVKYWAEHPQLKQYFDSGQMDCAIFDAVNDSNITLAKSGQVLAPGSVKNPLCVVANYLFDTLCHDIFQVCVYMWLCISAFLFFFLKAYFLKSAEY